MEQRSWWSGMYDIERVIQFISFLSLTPLIGLHQQRSYMLSLRASLGRIPLAVCRLFVFIPHTSSFRELISVTLQALCCVIYLLRDVYYYAVYKRKRSITT